MVGCKLKIENIYQSWWTKSRRVKAAFTERTVESRCPSSHRDYENLWYLKTFFNDIKSKCTLKFKSLCQLLLTCINNKFQSVFLADVLVCIDKLIMVHGNTFSML